MPERLPEAHVDGWQLVQYDAEHWKGIKPPKTPPREAEVSNDPCWSSLYHVDPETGRHSIVATWFRVIQMSERDFEGIRRKVEFSRAARKRERSSA